MDKNLKNANDSNSLAIAKDSRREFIKTSAKFTGAISLLGLNPLFANNNIKKEQLCKQLH